MERKPLPPLNSLVAFTAAARHGSFTLAASELNVTQGAISRQIRQLEAYLGKTLFIRANRSITLTATGKQYFQTVDHALTDIAQTTAEIKRWQGENKITVATTQAMAALWLLPRVSEFQQRYEDTDLRIIAMDQVQNWQQLDCDIALYYCRQPPQNMIATPLFPERVFPVCSPGFLNQLKNPDMQTFLASRRLCLDESQQEWVGWKEWFTLMDIPPIKALHETRINNYPLLIQAAVNGQGIALAWDSLVNDYLDGGSLVKPLNLELRTEASFCMLEPQHNEGKTQIVEQFRDW
ncbi:MAG: LysR substrate-binding domain-containing protein, partial [Thiolinea sp.]